MPPLQEQIIEFPFSGGVDEKTRSELVPQGMFAKLQNAVQLKHGAVGKAPGFAALPGGAAFTAGYRIMGCGNETLITANPTSASLSTGIGSLFTYSPGAQEWTEIGNTNPFSSITLPPSALVRSVYSFAAPEFVASFIPTGTAAYIQDVVLVANGLYFAVLWAYTGGTPLCVAFYDFASGAFVNFAAPLFNSSDTGACRLMAFGANSLMLLFASNASGTIKTSSFDTSVMIGPSAFPAGAWTTGFTVSAANPTTIDTINGGPTSSAYFAYVDSGTSVATVKEVNPSGAITTTKTVGTSVLVIGMGGGYPGTIWLAYADGSTVKVIGYDASLNVIATAATVLTLNGVYLGIVATSTTSGMLIASANGGIGISLRPFDTNAGAVRAGLAGNAQAFSIPALTPYSRPFAIYGHPYIMGATNEDANNQHSVFCIDLGEYPVGINAVNQGMSVATLSPRLSQGGTVATQGFPLIGTFVIQNSAYVVNTINSTALSTTSELVQLEFFSDYINQAVPYLDGLALSGGTPSYYDGTSVFEMNYLLAPTIASVTFSGTSIGTDFPVNSSWNWIAIYEWVDAKGQLHQSQPSAPFHAATTSTGYDIATVVASNSTLTAKIPAPMLAIYRTLSAGSTYYRVGTVTASPFVDAVSDSSLAPEALLYTQPGTLGTALPRQCPPSLLGIIAHNDSLFGFEGANVWYSGQPVIGEGPWWNDEFQFPVLGGIGPITGLASMDGNLLIFKRNSIFIVTGIGPADNGLGNSLSNPSRISVDLGCIEPRSILVTSAGCWFQSLRGIELLNRSLQLENFAGQPVEDTLTTYPTITSAVLHEQVGRVYWTVRQSDITAVGAIVMHDLVHQTWTTRPIVPFAGPKHASLLGSAFGEVPTYAYLADSGTVFEETPGNYLDASAASGSVTPAFSSSIIQTGPIKLSGIAGFQRVREVHILGQSNTRCDLTIALDYDNAGTFAETHSFTAAQIAAFSTSRAIVSVRPKQQKCRAIAVRITDATPSSGSLGIGQGCTFIGLRFRIGVKPGSARIPAANRA